MRDKSARLVYEGPVDIDESIGDFELSLYNADSARVSNQSDTNQESIPGLDDEDTVLAPLTGTRTVRLDGQTSFSRVSRGFPSLGRIESVREWIARFEALVLPQQGLGWKVDDKVRGVTYEPLDTDGEERRGLLNTIVTWTYSPSDGERFDWDIDAEFTEGVQTADDPQRYVERVLGGSPPERDELQVSGLSLEFDEVDQRRVRREIQLNNTDLIHQTEDSPMTGVIESGVETEVRFRGTVYRPDNFEGAIQDFDRRIQGEEATLLDMFAGRVWNGTVASSDSTIESARPNRFDFTVTLEVGSVVT